MLSNNVPSTPRPRPPAKMRRAPSLPLHPPPPYAPRMDMILDSPIAVTTQLIKSSPGEAALGTQDMEDWMNERSREELSDLLVAAEGIIKTRESELGLTSALCKNLYDENVHLKTRHDALLARLPKQGPSPLPSPTRSLSPLPPGSPHYYSISRPGSPVVRTSPAARHARRISVTPSELTLLADQNEELLEKLEQLEEESAQADLAGKRKLRKLEREIMGLREELEKTRAKGVELEQKATVIALSEDELLRRRREERERREERAKALREKSSAASSAGSTGDGSLDEPVRDFAPPPELPSLKNAIKSPATPSINLAGKTLSPLTSARKLTSPMSEPLPLQTVPEEAPSIRSESRLRVHPRLQLPSGASSYFPPPTQESTTHAPSLEYAVITQLLAKIRELEETNTQISSEQKATAERLQAAQWDAESISRAYECLVDGQREVHVVEDEPADTDDSIDANTSLDDSPARRTKHQSTGDTIRFSSLRRTIDGNLSRTSSSSGVFSVPTSPDREQIELDFAEGIRRELQSTTRSRLAGLPVAENASASASAGSHHEHSHYGHKARKSVMGLFDGVEVADAESTRDAEPLYPKTLSVSPAFLAQAKGADDSGDADGDVSIWSTDATDGLALHVRSRSGSPSASAMPSFLISPSASRAPSPSPSPSMHRFPTGSRNGHTLGSELGMEDWPAEQTGRWNYHLRTSSLCDITGVGNESAIAASASAAVATPLSADGTSPTATAPTTTSADSEETPVIRSLTTPPKLASPAGSSGWEDVSEDERPRKAKAKDRNVSKTEHNTASVGSTTPTRTGDVFKLQLVIEPPTPSPNRPLRTSRSARSLRVPMSGLGLGLLEEDGRTGEGRTSRNQRLSQTVRARTSRWVERMERRYGTLGAEDGVRASGSAFASGSGLGRPVRKRRSLGALRGHGHGHGYGGRHSTMDMDETFEAIMAQFSRSHSALSAIASGARPGFDESFDADADPDKSLLSADVDVSREEGAGDVSLSAEVMAARPRREGFAGLLLEVWLWLQFAVVVMVFLWAMARRGPKSVLEDAERRRGVVRR